MREHRSRFRFRFRNRRGAILVLTGIIMVTLVIMLAVVVDISRLFLQRNELQTASDAAAHAGALQLILRDSTHVADSAVAYGRRNSVINHSAAFPKSDVTCGVWNPATATFTTSAKSGTCGDSANAVKVIGRDSSQYLFKSVLTSTGVQMTTSAVAWAAPTVSSTSCIRPWGIPYWILTQRLDPTNPDSTRDLTAYDLHQLATLPRASLRFLLKVGPAPTVPGNFWGVSIGGSGGSQYRDNIKTCNPAVIGPDSVLDTETGDLKGPTTQGADILCQPHYASGACGDGHGGVGLPIKVPLWVTAATVHGKTSVTVKMIGSLALDSVTSAAEVIGHFIQSTDEGTIGTTPGTLVRIVLVQ